MNDDKDWLVQRFLEIPIVQKMLCANFTPFDYTTLREFICFYGRPNETTRTIGQYYCYIFTIKITNTHRE